jgi:hypothetical protein
MYVIHVNTYKYIFNLLYVFMLKITNYKLYIINSLYIFCVSLLIPLLSL